MTTQTHTVSVRNARPPKAELIARVEAILADVSPGSPHFQTALLYLASRWTPNIDRLAAFAACKREFVALRARRWADHGLWMAESYPACEMDRGRLLHAVSVGEGQVPRSAMTPWAEGAPLQGFLQPWDIRSETHASEPTPNGDIPEASHDRGAEEIADIDPLEVDGETLLANLWARLNLPARAVAQRKAA